MSFSFDFSRDKPDMREPIPAGTKLLVRMSYTPGGCDPEGAPRTGALTKSRDTDALYLKAEFTVLRGPYKGRKFWENMTFVGGKLDEKGQSIAGTITRGNIRLILDASAGLSAKDESPAACAQRVLPNGFPDLQGRVFAVKVGVEPAKGNYPAKNKLGVVLTIDHKDYPKSEEELDQLGTPAAPLAAALPQAAPLPTWAAASGATVQPPPPNPPAAAPNPGIAHTVAPVVAPAPPPAMPQMVIAPAATGGGAPLPAWMRP